MVCMLAINYKRRRVLRTMEIMVEVALLYPTIIMVEVKVTHSKPNKYSIRHICIYSI